MPRSHGPRKPQPDSNPAIMIAQTQMPSRVINVAPWDPLPGMVKRQCPQCRYLFAAPVAVAEAEEAPLCPDCHRTSPAHRHGGK